MKFELSQLTLFSPDEVLPHWFISHDFAALLGCEHSKQAAAVLDRAVAQRGVSIDYEADAVTLRISKKQLVVPTLSSLYDLFKWDPAELARIQPAIESFTRPKPRPVTAGDIFEVPVAADLAALGQVLEIRFKSPTVAIFRRPGPLGAIPPSELADEPVLTILHIGGDSLYTGRWPIVGSCVPNHEPSSGPGGQAGAVAARVTVEMDQSLTCSRPFQDAVPGAKASVTRST